MQLRSFHLSDFGCFNLAQMRDIEDGLVVVGGPQRAGKTTFMQAVRQLGPWGVNRGDALPPASDEYRLSAEIEHDGNEFTLSLNGFSNPTLASMEGENDVGLGDIFGGISRTQYEQLFTISLDELKRLPDGVESEEDLSEVLLGAAYGDVADIPRMQNQFHDAAHKIGRKYGKPTKNSQLRGPMDTIEAGIDLRDDALNQVEAYNEKEAEYTGLIEEIEGFEAAIDSLERERERLSVIESEFEDLRTYQQLGRTIENSEIERAKSLPDDALQRAERLQRELEETQTALDDAREAFEEVVSTDRIADRQEALLNVQEQLERYYREVAGWREQVSQIESDASELSEERSDLQRQIENLYEPWTGDFEPVLSVKVDQISRDELRQAVEKFNDADSELESAKSELGQKEAALEESETRLEDLLEEHEASDSSRKAIWVTALAGLLAVAAVLGGQAVGAGVGGVILAVAILGIGVYYATTKLGGGGGSTSPVQEERARQNSLKDQIQELRTKIENEEERRQVASEQIETGRETLGLPSDVSPDATWEFYEDVVALRGDIRELRSAEVDLNERRAETSEVLNEAASVATEVADFSWDEEEPLDHADELFDTVERVHQQLERALELESIQAELVDIEESIESLVDEWDGYEPPEEIDSDSSNEDHLDEFLEEAQWASELLEDMDRYEELRASLEDRYETKSVREAFEEVRTDDDEEWVVVLEEEAEEFVDRESVEERLDRVRDEIDARREELEGKNEQRVQLEDELAKLKSDEDIVEARRQITDGRAELRRLGESFAVNRLAEHLTDRLHERFLEEMAGPLIEEASEIFREITQEYDGIEHTEQLDDLDFEALREDGPAHSRTELSRATTEQLFLAVRLARIRQLETSLPVVMDDSMTNFDPAHGARTLNTVTELAKTNQVFFLTCHPEQLALLEDHSDVSQYWCLEDGSFDGPHSESSPVYELLHVQRG